MPRFTKSFLFPDINVWVAVTYDRHVHHGPARKWFLSLDGSSQVFFCRFTQLGLLRLLTTEAVMGPDRVLSQQDAWEVYDRWTEDPRISLIGESPSLEPEFRSLSRLNRPAPKDWADSYLLAFANSSELTLVTFDRGFLHRYQHVIVLRKAE
jgi:uncharacterized protein